ncbi:uncharacterized protein LOC106645896 [Copidosoma floridanum]|uniref:uncharacterized protein LOC106645896 n=1 Tax=Copidosoma floridanum TaxID=29053 RepID=UPI000C6FA255|nr:uncharacterized protein LOC106645896 [Copidosoma floridanum]
MRKKNPEQLYPKEGTLDRLVLERIIRLWSNFAAFGNPTPETDDKYITTVWKPASKEHLYYLEINKDLQLRDDRDSKSWPCSKLTLKNHRRSIFNLLSNMERPIVTIREGQLQGVTLKSILGPSYYAFKGIPYAAPPLGPLRFKVPQPPEKWSGVRDASNYAGDDCMQLRDDIHHEEIVGNENCLYLSVFTKTLSPDRPVMVFIHGGSFVEGTTNRDVYRQDYLVTQDVVLVNINYRVGIFGFLSLGHEVASGNVGIRDVLCTLQWVQNNIKAFGGNPNNVTIYGSSAGAVISHLLTLIPKAKGLFHKAIIQSGTCNGARTLTGKYDIKNGFRIAAHLGMQSKDPLEVIEFLRSMPATKLVECKNKILSKEEAIQYDLSLYMPVIDVDYTSDPVIPGTFEELKNNNADIPIMIGHTPDESLLMFVDKFTDETYEYYNDNLEDILKNKLKDPNELPNLMEEVREFYLKNQPINKENEWNLIHLTSDFTIHADRQIIDYRVESATAPTYVYMFSYMGDEPTIYQTDHGPQPLKGIAHADELSYLFYLPGFPCRKKFPDQLFPKEGTLDRLVTERIIRLWSNFAAFGPVVTISEGQLQGTTLKSVLGPNYYAFKGIPFAAPPFGPLRFKEPQPPSKWDGIRDASNYVGDACMQLRDDILHDGIVGSENCLYLNVFTKTLNPNRPVMVFIHGGSFIEGTSNRDVYRQDYLVTQDVVLVNINYRVGIFGFLSLGHEVAPSNIGLRDILFSLQWVQNNIKAFGGNPNNVTVFGSSAGAVISHLLTLIPKAKGLLHKAIIQSGTCNGARTLTGKYDIKNGFRIAAHLGMQSKDPLEVIEFLRSMPATKLVECKNKILSKEEAIQYDLSLYMPVIDVDYTSDPVIPGTFEELKNNNADIPIMIGHTPDESLLMFVDKFTDDTYKYYNDHIESIIRNKLKDPTVFPELMKEVQEFYLKNKPIDSENVWNLIRLTSDLIIHANRQVIDHRVESATAPTYVYMFSYMGDELTVYQNKHGPQPLKGVAHADELSYLFYLSRFPMRKKNPEQLYPKEGTLDRLVLERIIRLWSNFAAFGNPTPETDDKYITTVWKPASKEHLYYLEINKDLQLRDDRDSKSWPFYEKNSDYFEKF